MKESADDQRLTWQEIYEKVERKIPEKTKIKGFKEWFFKNEKNGKLFDYSMIARCFTAYQDMKDRNKDHFALVIGEEGNGKSTFAAQLASWIDPDNFSVDNICFTPTDYLERLRKAEPGSCLVIDEGGVNLFSRETMSQNNVRMTKLFMLQRQKNVSVVVCCPSFWDVDAYIRRHRVNTLIRIYKQGEYQGMLKKCIDIINQVGYRKKPLTQIKLPLGYWWYGNFRKTFPYSIDVQKYLIKKREHLETFLDDLEEDMGLKKDFKIIPAAKVAKEMCITNVALSEKIRNGTVVAKKIGRAWYIPKEEYLRLTEI